MEMPISTKLKLKTELSVEDGCLLWGSRVVIPPQARDEVLTELHEAHPGASQMKALARSYVWWPNMDKDIENLVRLCEQCQLHQGKRFVEFVEVLEYGYRDLKLWIISNTIKYRLPLIDAQGQTVQI